MAEAKPAADKSKIADVAHPGKTPPSDTSKPIITNRPVLKDPMVVEDDAAAKVAVTIDKPHVGRILSPDKPATDDKPATIAKAEDSADPEKPEKPVTPKTKTTETPPEDEKSIAEAAPETDDEPAPAIDNETDASEEETAETTPDDDTQKTPKTASADLQAEKTKQAEHDAAIQKLVESKQYYLPINSVEKRRTKRVLLLGVVLSIVLVAAWVDVALDAGLVQIDGLKPVTHFFSN